MICTDRSSAQTPFFSFLSRQPKAAEDAPVEPELPRQRYPLNDPPTSAFRMAQATGAPIEENLSPQNGGIPSPFPPRFVPQGPALIPLPPLDQESPATSAPNQELDRIESLAVAALQREDWKAAEKYLNQILAQNPTHRDALKVLANMLRSRERPADAVKLLQQYHAHFSDDAEITMIYGRALLENEETDAAIRSLLAAERIDPKLDDVRFFLGSAYLQAELPMKAWSAVQQGENSSAEASQYQLLTEATALAQLGQLRQADTIFFEVFSNPQSQAVAEMAENYRHEIKEALLETPRFFGAVKLMQRYDDNAGVIPTSNLFNAPPMTVPSFGGLLSADLNYYLLRTYQTNVVAGYAPLATHYYRDLASQFDLIGHSGYLSMTNIGLTPWRDRPYVAAIRTEFDRLDINTSPYLQRWGGSVALSIKENDIVTNSAVLQLSNFDFLGLGPGIEGSPSDADSFSCQAAFSRQWQTWRRNLKCRIGYAYNRNESQGSDFDYNGHIASCGLSYDFEDESYAAVDLQYFYRHYDHVQTISGITREDSEILLGASYVRPLWREFDLLLTYAYDLNDSDLVSNTYDRNVIEIGVQWNFGQNDPNEPSQRRWLR
ncbi:hypothetical protein DSM3645_20542 [Blastopirellula marina DSM 3645]|uniref:Uncharacterized protein n=1 Tax=Blastopirellula marina DSM 3645 TaxID=314230 RepID=A3ZQR0_9BACT|nr:hypothetical protein DSM3645_20542 [Blastopirellula marina DSM 3645]